MWKFRKLSTSWLKTARWCNWQIFLKFKIMKNLWIGLLKRWKMIEVEIIFPQLSRALILSIFLPKLNKPKWDTTRQPRSWAMLWSTCSKRFWFRKMKKGFCNKLMVFSKAFMRQNPSSSPLLKKRISSWWSTMSFWRNYWRRAHLTIRRISGWWFKMTLRQMFKSRMRRWGGGRIWVLAGTKLSKDTENDWQ